MYGKTHVPKNGESRNDKRKPQRKIRTEDDHGDFCAFSNYQHQLNYKTTNYGFYNNPHDTRRHRKKRKSSKQSREMFCKDSWQSFYRRS